MNENVQHKKLVDSGGGFFLDEDNLIEEKQKELDLVEEPCKYKSTESACTKLK